jgi:3-hydroxyisobutyrate dehydrogenase-like beta-hydroxyacid dehydrogenase
LATECDVVITSLPDVPDVREFILGEQGLAAGASAGLLYIDMSTITPSAALDHQSILAAKGVRALDAPVSGGPARAADGTLTIMVGGHEEDFELAVPILSLFGSHIVHAGSPGSGQAVKLVNQLIISVIMIANAEALTLGVKAGIPLQTLLDVVSTSSGSNYLLTQWMPKTLFTGDTSTGFALDLLRKDLRAALQWAQDEGAPTFAGALAQELYSLVRSDENAREDYSIVTRIYEAENGVELRL